MKTPEIIAAIAAAALWTNALISAWRTERRNEKQIQERHERYLKDLEQHIEEERRRG